MTDMIGPEVWGPQHEPECQWSVRRVPCRKFSTDGSYTGALIAHTMGTTDQATIARSYRMTRIEDGVSQIDGPAITGMDPEQREWEGHDSSCEAEFIQEAGMWSPCRCFEGRDEG